jgi:hypothetical protein
MRVGADKGHLVELRKLEFKFIRSILGIPQYTLELVGPVVVLNPLFKLSGRSLVAVRFGLQVVQGPVRKLQFTFLANVSIPRRIHPRNSRRTWSLHRSWRTFSCSSRRPRRAEPSTRSPSRRFRFTSRLEVFCTSLCSRFSSSSASSQNGDGERSERTFPSWDGRTYEVLVPLDGLRRPRARSSLIPKARSSADVEMLGSVLR